MSKETGEVCMGLLGGGEGQWEPSFTIQNVIINVIGLLIRPEVSIAMDHDTLNQYHHFKWNYDSEAKASAIKSASVNKE